MAATTTTGANALSATPAKLENVRRPASRGDSSVLAARALLEDSLHLQGLPERLSQCSRRLNEARACSTPFAEVRSELTAAGAALARASEGARAACLSFVKVSKCALDDLDDARDLLVAGATGAARASLRTSRTRARNAGKISAAVAEDLEKAARMVSRAEDIARLLHTQQTAAARAQKRRAVVTQATLEDARERRMLAREDVSEAHAHYLTASNKERTAITRANVAHAAQVLAVVGAAAGTRSPKLAMVGAAGVGAICKAADAGVLRAREEKAVFLAQKLKARQRQLDVTKTIEELAAELRMEREEHCIDDKSLNDLAEVVEGLRRLAGCFLDAGSFWGRIRGLTEHENIASDGGILDIVQQTDSDGLDTREQQELWKSPGFVRRMNTAYQHWTALLSICEDAVEGLDTARCSLYQHIAAVDMNVDNMDVDMGMDMVAVEK